MRASSLFAYDDPTSFVNSLRGRRHAHVVEELRSLQRPDRGPLRILDLGGSPRYWAAHGVPDDLDVEVTILQKSRAWLTWEQMALIDSLDFSCRVVVGDATRAPFRDHEFDLAFSNSVIEHLGGRPQMLDFAAETHRLATRHVIQTPAQTFPLDPHTLVPMFQFLPRAAKIRAIHRFGLRYYEHTTTLAEAAIQADSIQMLTERSISGLFPTSVIHVERMAGLAKSYVAIGSGRTSARRSEVAHA